MPGVEFLSPHAEKDRKPEYGRVVEVVRIPLGKDASGNERFRSVEVTREMKDLMDARSIAGKPVSYDEAFEIVNGGEPAMADGIEVRTVINDKKVVLRCRHVMKVAGTIVLTGGVTPLLTLKAADRIKPEETPGRTVLAIGNDDPVPVELLSGSSEGCMFRVLAESEVDL